MAQTSAIHFAATVPNFGGYKMADLVRYLHEWFEVAGIVPAALAAGGMSGIPATKVRGLQNSKPYALPT